MNRRAFFAALAAPFVARLVPKPEPEPPKWLKLTRTSYPSIRTPSVVEDIERAMKTMQSQYRVSPDVFWIDGRQLKNFAAWRKP